LPRSPQLQGRWRSCDKIGNPERFQIINITYYSICPSMSRFFKQKIAGPVSDSETSN
jgi:hypothetical protein